MVGYYASILADLDDGLDIVVLINGPGEIAGQDVVFFLQPMHITARPHRESAELAHKTDEILHRRLEQGAADFVAQLKEDNA